VGKVEDMSMDYQLLLEERLSMEVLRYNYAARDEKHSVLQEITDILCALTRSDSLEGDSMKFSGGCIIENSK